MTARMVRPMRTHIRQGGQTMAGAPIFQILQVGLESPDNPQLQSGDTRVIRLPKN